MTDPTGATANANPPPAREISAPANTESTIVLDPCSHGSPCLVCWLRKRIADDPETSYQSFRTGELELNIVGIRRRDSVTDKFDDFMVVFFKPVVPEHRQNFERVIEQDLRDDWNKIFGKSAKRTKLVPCTKDRASWVVAIYPLSTDPGLTELPEEKAAKAKKASEKDVQDKQAAATKADKELAEAKEQAKAKQAAYDELPPDEPPDPMVKLKKGAPKSPKAQALAAAKAAQAKVTKAEKAKKAADAELKTAKDTDARNATTLASEQEKSKSQPPIAVLGDGTEGGLAVGRGMMACRAYPNEYMFYIHHAGSASMFPKGHVALTVGMIPDGYRAYSVSLVKSASWETEAKKAHYITVKVGDKTESRAEVGELFVGGKKPGEKFAKATATLVTTQTAAQKTTKTRDVSLEVNGVKRPLADGDVLLLRAEIGGTNLHRGHNAKVAASGDEVVPGAAGGGKVKSFSEGCQVNPDFDAFNQFIRLAAIGKRWTCAKGKAETPGCDRLVAADGEELGKGEQALLDSFGRRYINKATATRLAKDVENKAKADRDAAQAIIDALENDSKNEDEQAKAKKIIADQNKRIADEDKAIQKLTEANAKQKPPKTAQALAAVLEPHEKKKAAAIATRDDAQKRLDELKKKETLEKDAIEARRKLLNERTRFFRGDFLRECDLQAGGGAHCRERFTYVLVEFDDAGCNELDRRFKEGRNQDWDGKIVLPG
jgi:hypothetical protein